MKYYAVICFVLAFGVCSLRASGALLQTKNTIDVSITLTGTVEEQNALYEKVALQSGWFKLIQVGNELVPNPETAKQFSERMLERKLLEDVRRYDEHIASTTAGAAARKAVDDANETKKKPVPTPTPKVTPSVIR